MNFQEITPIKLYDDYQKANFTISEGSTVSKGKLKMYSCGPTVYNYQHIGNLFSCGFLPDIVARIARMSGFEVKWVENITDVGHLVGDGDEGDDKLELGAKREHQSVSEIVDRYTKHFEVSAKALNIDLPKGKLNPKATEYIEMQMLLALLLLKQDRAYVTTNGIYFNSKQNPSLEEALSQKVEAKVPVNPSPEPLALDANQNKEEINYSGREIVGQENKNPADFALWKFISSNNLQKWRFSDFPEVLNMWQTISDTHPNLQSSSDYFNESTWGAPGWHPECVAMIYELFAPSHQLNGEASSNLEVLLNTLHEQEAVIDLHFGGEDHISVHHKNEILLSEALGIHLSTHWVHNKFILVDGQKMAKSEGNLFLVTGQEEITGFPSIEDKGYDPLAFRLMLIEHHYREPINFTWDKLTQSQNRLFNLRKEVAKIRSFSQSPDLEAMDDQKHELQKQEWLEILTTDLNLPKFLDIYQEALTHCVNRIQTEGKLAVHDHFNLSKFGTEILKLKLFELELPQSVLEKAEERWSYKQNKDFQTADKIRDELAQIGWQIGDYTWGWGIWWKGTSE